MKRILLIFSFFFFLQPTFSKVRIRIKAYDDSRRDYEYLFTLTKKEVNRLEGRLEKVLKAYKKKSRQEMAKDQGYAEEIYGKDFYEQVNLSKFLYMIYDDRFNRILYKNTRETRVDDF